MRAQLTKQLVDDEGVQLLSTGEAAGMLGVSRQHIVDLCNTGLLPY